jgi:hypothetical protein
MTHNSGVFGSAFTETRLLLIVNETIDVSLIVRLIELGWVANLEIF